MLLEKGADVNIVWPDWRFRHYASSISTSYQRCCMAKLSWILSRWQPSCRHPRMNPRAYKRLKTRGQGCLELNRRRRKRHLVDS